jgi:hypothetical protein
VALRDFLARKLDAEIDSIEATDAKPTLYGCAVGPFTGATGETLILEVNGVPATVPFTGDVIATVVADINAAVTTVTASADVQADGSRLKIQGNTAAVLGTPQRVAVTGGTALDYLGLAVGDYALEVAVPTMDRRHIHAFDAEAAGLEPPMPMIWMSGRTAEDTLQGNEGLHTLGLELTILTTATGADVAERHVDLIVRAISQLLAEDRTVDGAVRGCFLTSRVQTPIFAGGAGGVTTGAGATCQLQAVYAETFS